MRKQLHIAIGATGFVGGFLTAELLKRGHDVVILARDAHNATTQDRIKRRLQIAYGKSLPAGCNYRILSADITNPNLGLGLGDFDRFAEVDAVWHCAAMSKFNTDNTSIFKTNALGTLHVLDFASRIKAKRFHYVSTAYVCGDRTGTVREDELEAGQRLKNDYEESKFRAEHLVKEWSLEFGLQTSIYRPSVIVGSSVDGRTTTFNGYNYLTKVFYRQRRAILKGFQDDPDKFAGSGIRKTVSGLVLPVRIPCSSDATVNIVTIDHVIDVMLRLASKPDSIGRVFHITDSNPPKGRDLFNMSTNAMGIDGIGFVDAFEKLKSQSSNSAMLQRYEQKISREISQYIPYLRQEPRFDDSNVQEVLGVDYKPPRKIDRPLIQKLFEYAKSVDWTPA